MKITFKWIGGATWILHVDDVAIACDPVLCPKGHVQDYKYFKTKRLNDPAFDEGDFGDVQLWLLTHAHEDHIDRFGLRVIGAGSVVFAHAGLERIMKKSGAGDIRFLRTGETSEVSIRGMTIGVRAVPAIHAKRSIFGGVVGNGNGYLVEIEKGAARYTLYATGDSVYRGSAIGHLGGSAIDLIVANAGAATVGSSCMSKIIGRITNNRADIIAMNKAMRPRRLIPVHWGTFSHYSEALTPASFDGIPNITVPSLGKRLVLSD